MLRSRNLILGCKGVRDLKIYMRIYEISCMPSGDNDDLDRILGETGVRRNSSDDGVTIKILKYTGLYSIQVQKYTGLKTQVYTGLNT